MKKARGQVILEFTFCMVVIMFMIYGLTKVFLWSGADLAERRKAHDKSLTQSTGNPESQIHPYFHKHEKLNAIWK